jgi:serine/threonine-protein kinase RsbW
VLSVSVDRLGPPSVRLSLSNRPENVLLVRQMITGLAEAIQLETTDLNDISTAVTEACNNVVLHAYGGKEGPLEIEIYARLDVIEVVVRDHGTGILPRTDITDEAPGIGVPVIRALAQSSEFRNAAGDAGTEVRMEFPTPRVSALEPLPEDEFEMPGIVATELASTMEITIAPTPLARTILPRLLSVSAARAHFTTDRIADLQALAHALVVNVPGSISGDHLSIGIHVEPHDLELRIAPLRMGRADQLIVAASLNDLAPLIDRLTDHQRIATSGSAPDVEMLALRLIDPR